MAGFSTDESLISALLDGSDAGFVYAVKQYQPGMRQLAISICGEAISDEVVQEAWFSAIRSLSRFEGRSSLKTWLLRIVANEAKSRLRRENRLTSLEALTQDDENFVNRFDERGHWSIYPSDWHVSSPDELISSEQLQQCLNTLIAALPDLQSATLQLKEHQNYSLHEICNILEVSESNVRVLLHRARQRLYRCIEHFQATGECCTT